MRIGLFLLSIGLIIVTLGEITFPLSLTVYTNSTFTMPPWYTKAEIMVNSGNFTIFYENGSINKLNSSDSIVVKELFYLKGSGNASMLLEGYKIFYGNEAMNVGLILSIVGIAIEITRLIIKKEQ
ncbi:hypothetical protein DJ531_04865 [Sulfolobus sp. A20-N-F6]|nr:hypothetical protein DJ532_10755 [Sulfolobus sp. A20-N-F8]TRM82068.1 hypothetical protein DJ524_01950 [Sulfolobus sp. D5]TRM83598.1 hypothetical protein DJ531_04865 [Sulfolobus sp. A20-N-F6]TRM88154.1 hypothetical protein DJ521_02375 [Sulfolobus sp. E3]TRM88344.1 hypothetical protein DJ529_05705 [Sulfolobus sp. C3]TRM95322.1 hypothetical protein DJ526_00745 [Sulfolobus sp. A20-N-G8]TRM96881.1 hypothetical protein DJ530_12480 [Sulfolobus sp. E1]TRM97336.1 hypothetical protein DMP16_03020 [